MAPFDPPHTDLVPAVAALVRAADGGLVGTCFCVSTDGAFLGAEHYLHSNGIRSASDLAVRLGDGTQLPVREWRRELTGDVVLYRADARSGGPPLVPVASAGTSAPPADGARLWVAGYGLDLPGTMRSFEGVVSGRDRITVEPDITFDGFYVECEAVDGMSGSPALDPESGGVVALLSGLNPDWGIAAFCPLPELAGS